MPATEEDKGMREVQGMTGKELRYAAHYNMAGATDELRRRKDVRAMTVKELEGVAALHPMELAKNARRELIHRGLNRHWLAHIARTTGLPLRFHRG